VLSHRIQYNCPTLTIRCYLDGRLPKNNYQRYVLTVPCYYLDTQESVDYEGSDTQRIIQENPSAEVQGGDDTEDIGVVTNPPLLTTAANSSNNDNEKDSDTEANNNRYDSSSFSFPKSETISLLASRDSSVPPCRIGTLASCSHRISEAESRPYPCLYPLEKTRSMSNRKTRF
jgi:hypothetical protein